MSCSIHISTARSMLNSGDPVDISSAEPKRFAFGKTITVWKSACRFRSTAEKEFRRLDSRTQKLHLPAIQFLRRLAQRQVAFIRQMSHHRFSALLAKKSATAASSKSTTLKYFFDFSQIIRNFAKTLKQYIYVTKNPFICFSQHYIF